MVFTKRLREGVRRRVITCSIRVWTRPHVKVGGRYRMDEGEIEIESIEPIERTEVTPQLARESGFSSVAELLKIARHGKGENIYLIRFRYLHTVAEPSGPDKRTAAPRLPLRSNALSQATPGGNRRASS